MGSISLQAARVSAEATNLCVINVEVVAPLTSGSATIVPSDVGHWKDTVAFIAREKAAREIGERLNYSWNVGGMGVSRSVTDHGDSLNLVVGGAEIPATADELPRLFALVDSAAARTLRMSSANSTCRGSLSEQGYPPTLIEMFMPSLPVPENVRGFHLVAEFDVDSTGKVLDLT